VSSPYRNPEFCDARAAALARLIPGDAPAFRGQRKPPQSVQQVRSTAAGDAPISIERPAQFPVNGLIQLLPAPFLQGKSWPEACAVAKDFALIALNWLLLGALLVPLRKVFPQVTVFGYYSGAPGSLLGIALLNAALIALLGSIEGLYNERACEIGNPRLQPRVLGKSVLWATALLGLAYRLQGLTWATIALFGSVGVLNFGWLWTWRWHSAMRRRRTMPHASDRRNVLIVGAGGAGRKIAAYIEAHPDARAVFGFLDDEKPLGDGVIGRISDLAHLARTGFVDEVILAAPRDRKLTLQVLREAQRLRLNLKMIPELYGGWPVEDEIEHVGDSPLVCLHAERMPVAGLGLKRLVDIMGASLALLLLSPLFALIAVLIKLDSPGPVFYRALRAGRKSRPFLCCKFRTMVSDADALKDQLRKINHRSGPFFKIVNDPRITRLGRFLRRYSLDEFPQLWNVLRGEMSLVGPRPHPMDDLAGYKVEHLARLDVTPGMTGLWQVTARRDPSFQRGMELDREYIRTWSLTADLCILLKTFRAVVQGSGD
jgi:exopolysaccharide biosynthesis polyprenyl glycosylphosphotransferase